MTRSREPRKLDGSEKVELEEIAVDTARLQDRKASNQDKIEHYKSMLIDLKKDGTLLRADACQPDISIEPAWLNRDLFDNAKSVFERHFMGMSFAHLSGLLLLVRVDSIYRTLSATGKSDTVSKLFRRYYHTVKHIKTWYEGDIFEKGGDAYRSLLTVRGMHNKVSHRFNDIKDTGHLNGREAESAQNGTGKPVCPARREASSFNGPHISEYDIMITQFAFIGFIVTNADKMGLIDDFSAYDLESLIHFWRVIGYYLGASDRFNLCSYKRDDLIGLCNAIIEAEYKPSILKNPLHEPAGIMSVNIVRSVKFIPMLTVYGMMRHLYEILDLDTREVEPRKSWYSKLSYILIKLVMTRLLGYKALRSFNNGLTRLSLYLVGKIEDTFASHLKSEYGDELKI